MEHKCCQLLICKKTESSYYMSTNALCMSQIMSFMFFDVCNNCETVFLTNPVPERLEITTPKTIYPTEVL
jgi:hypothetical protein